MNTNTAITMPARIFGLCSGRHDLPVQGYVFGEVKDIFDFAELNRIAERFVLEHCNPRRTWGTSPAQVDLTDVEKYVGDPVDVIVTGLTAATTALMWACACYGVPLTLWHFDRETGEYKPQRFYF